MTGLLLCGGNSLRMGNDKGMLSLQSATWAEQISAIITTVCHNCFVSVNEEQLLSYQKIFSAQNIITDNNSLQVKGPLKGILSAHLQHDSEDLLVVACDLIDMQSEVLNFLITQHKIKVDADISVYKNAGQVEPLCGIYSSNALHTLIGLVKEQKLAKYSMMYALEQVHTNYVLLPDQWKASFTNYNTPDDLKTI
jgi:molybdopterin-guanine dinucleotide biosynthesis protein A